MPGDSAAPIDIADARTRVARHLAELQRLHLVLASDSQSLKEFSLSGGGLTEIRLGYELLEQYIAISDAFVENMRGRFEARLGVLRRAEPQIEGKPGHAERAPGHTQFWLEYSRLTAVLARISRRIGQ